MRWLLYGYLFLFIFRPQEYVHWPGVYHIERIYVGILLLGTFLAKGRTYKHHRINVLFLCFFAVMILSSALSANKQNAFTATYHYFAIVVFYFVIVLLLNTEEDLNSFIYAYLVIMFLYIGKSAWEFFLHDRYIYRMGIRRLTGLDETYGDPNAFAASIVYSFPFLWAMLRSRFLTPPRKFVLFAYSALSLVCILFTGSRSGFVAGALFLILVALGSSRKIVGLVLILTGFVVAWNFVPDDYQIRIESTFVKGLGQPGADASAEGRIGGLLHGLHVFSEHPVVGIGPDNFRYSWEIRMNAHNLYGQLLAELGLLGALSFAGLVGTTVVAARKLARNGGEFRRARGEDLDVSSTNHRIQDRRLLATAVVQVILLLLFNGNFGHNLYRFNWLLAGAVVVVLQAIR